MPTKHRVAINRGAAPENLPYYLTVDELGAYLKLGRSAAYAFAREHGRRFGKLLRVPREAVTK